MKLGAYFRLMRVHKPAGTLLLWIPTAWALWLANQGTPPLNLMVYFFAGTVVMRAAGCVLNDIADRHIDKHVKRTAMRPLTTGEVSLFEALSLVAILLLVAFIIVIQLPILCFFYALIAMVVTMVYPFCKRFIQAPQLVLGVAFSMGIPMAYAASGVMFNSTALLLFIINFAWIVSYDTMYAMADRDDDLRIGVKSTAVLFAQYDRLIILMLQMFFHLAWLYLAISLQYSMTFYGCWVIALLILISQQELLSRRNADSYLAAFSKNVGYGLVMWGALVLG